MPVVAAPGVINPLWPICGRGRGPYLRPLNALPTVGVAAQEPALHDAAKTNTLPTVGVPGRGRGSWLADPATLPALGAQPPPVQIGKAEERDPLPKVGAVAPRIPSHLYRTRVFRRTSRPTRAAIQAMRTERQEWDQRWAVYGSLHMDRAEVDPQQPRKDKCPESRQVAVTLQAWSNTRWVETNY